MPGLSVTRRAIGSIDSTSRVYNWAFGAMRRIGAIT
jgi:hypothetical protein